MLTPTKLVGDLLDVKTNLLLEIAAKRTKSVDKYVWIQTNICKEAIVDPEFQRVWSDFYRLNTTRISKDQKQIFYTIFAEYWDGEMNYETLITKLIEVRGSVESSFSSKIQHSKFPTLPIIDSEVAKVLGWKLPREQASTKAKMIDLTTSMVDRLNTFYANCFEKDGWYEISSEFDAILGVDGFQYTEVKKIDILLWQRNSIKNN